VKEIMIGSGLFWMVLNSFRALMMGLTHEAHVELLKNGDTLFVLGAIMGMVGYLGGVL
jgi:hypothetical protein